VLSQISADVFSYFVSLRHTSLSVLCAHGLFQLLIATRCYASAACHHAVSVRHVRGFCQNE